MRHFRNILIAGFLTFTLSSGLTACQNNSIQSPALCTETDLSVKCLLELGESKLDATALSFERVSGAAELAIAYDSSNNPREAGRLISQALSEANTISDLKQRGNAYSEILVAIAAIKPHKHFNLWALKIHDNSADLDINKQADILAKTVIAQMVQGHKPTALGDGFALPENTETEKNYKAVTLRKLAELLAEDGEFDGARHTVDAITMSIPYYQAMARSDVARHANAAGEKELAKLLLNEAELIARAQDNGYFIGAALRDIGYTHALNGDMDMARKYFAEARQATATAPKQHEKARATSRIATRMADAGLGADTEDILKVSAEMAKRIESDVLKNFSYYEIIGSAAFTGQFDIAYELLDELEDISMGSTSSLKNAARRDLAWGLARHGKLEEAVSLTKTITTPREYLQAISRIIRGQNNPEMTALPRYL